MALNNPLDAGSLRVFASSATSDGNVGGTTIVCSGLPIAGASNFDGNLVIITSGTYKGEARTIEGATTGETITVASPFSGQILTGVKFGVFGIRSGVTDVSAILADTGELQTDWANGGRLDLLIDEILADTNELQTDWADGGRLDLLLDSVIAHSDNLARIRCQHEPPATAIIEEIQVTTGAADKALGTIVVAGIPSGATVTEAYVDLEFRAVEDTSQGVNKLNGAQNIQIQKGAGAFATAIALPDDLFTVAASTREGGMLIRGTVDVSATVTADDTYTIKWTSALSDADNLQFNDVQARLRITFSV